MPDANLCTLCFLTKMVKCPCGVCNITTMVPYCPDCERSQLNQWLKMNGTAVCEAYAKAELSR